jgi:glucose-6-phosphate 1-epimerase
VERAVQEAPELVVDGELDRVYFDVLGPIVVLGAGRSGESLTSSATGFPDAVLWNPGPGKALALPDLEAREFREMLCVEAAAVGAPIRLSPGGRWEGTQQIRVVR